ncbi:MAG: glutathione S-transferase family protein [Gammaproteobacteria bacterium]|nr:MAG: glutathione S-transferase family protein [Gammaproteobacteria bacterium]
MFSELPIAELIIVAMLAFIVSWYVWEKHQRRTHAMPGGLHEEITLPHRQSWELYHNNLSLCSKKTRVCLSELSIDYVSHHVDLIETGRYENVSREFLKVNPAGLVPVLVYQGHPVYESHEQIAFASAHSDDPNRLVPVDPDRRRLMDDWVRKTSLVGDDPVAALHETAGNAIPGLTLPLFATMLERIPLKRIFEGLLFHRLKRRAFFLLIIKLYGIGSLTSAKPLLRVAKASRDAMHRHLDDLEQTLRESGGPWIVGEQFSLADVGMMAILERLREADWLDVFVSGQRPRVAAYWRALQTRPSYQSAIADCRGETIEAGTARLVDAKLKNPVLRFALTESMT